MTTTEVCMPIIKSSENGEHITVIVFTSSEMQALTNLLSNINYDDNPNTVSSRIKLDELFYALGIRVA